MQKGFTLNMKTDIRSDLRDLSDYSFKKTAVHIHPLSFGNRTEGTAEVACTGDLDINTLQHETIVTEKSSGRTGTFDQWMDLARNSAVLGDRGFRKSCSGEPSSSITP
jgi:hypothetical protein